MEAKAILEKLDKYNLDGFKHTDEGLVNHLMGTYNILKDWACSKNLCIAGLCHSIYGTESYRNNPVDVSERNQIRDLIGDEAEKIVYYFGAHVKDTLWENLDRDKDYYFLDRLESKEISISTGELSDLITLTLANWLEQRPRADKKYHFIRQNEFLRSRKYLPKCAYEEFKAAYEVQ